MKDKEYAYEDVRNNMVESSRYRKLDDEQKNALLKIFDSYKVVPSGNYVQRCMAYRMLWVGFMSGIKAGK